MLQQFYRAHITVNYLHKTRVYAHRKCTLTNSKNRIIDHLSYLPTACIDFFAIEQCTSYPQWRAIMCEVRRL